MTCSPGMDDESSSLGTFYTLCCDGDLCNAEDPRDDLPEPYDGQRRYACTTYDPDNTEQESEDCANGVNLEDKVVNCEEEGWGSSCIARVLHLPNTDTDIWIRSCLAPEPMTCSPGIDDESSSLGTFYTDCCDGDLCNAEDPRDDLTTTTPDEETTLEPYDGQRCYACSTYDPDNTEQESEDCANGVNLEDKVVNCEAEGWGSSCIARVLHLPNTDTDIWIRSCLAPEP